MEFFSSSVHEVLCAFFPELSLEERGDTCPPHYTIRNTAGGVNNFVKFVDIKLSDNAEETTYVLRIYNNGQRESHVQFEHEVLRLLSACNFSFKIPTFIRPAGENEPNSSYIRLPSGDLACISTVINGRLPKAEFVTEIGRAAGELTSKLSRISPSMPCPIAPIHDLYAVHSSIDREQFFSILESMSDACENDAVRDQIEDITRATFQIEIEIDILKEQQLPEQIIHGDLHYDNVLVDDNNKKVSGIVDFEFCSYDWRAMELAICLSKYLSEDSPLALIEDFAAGYFSSLETKFSEDEINAIPILIKLRIISNLVFFAGRQISGEDASGIFAAKIAPYMRRIAWLENNSILLTEVVDKLSLK